MNPRHTLRLLLALAAAAVVLLTACGSPTPAAPAPGDAGTTTLRVGVPRNFGILSTLWARDVQPEGVRIEYTYFPNFPDMLQALNAGRIDFTEIGDIGALQSFANGGGRVQAVGVSEPNPRQVGILVRPDSGITGPAQLRGKRIAFLRSTNSYPFVLNYLARAGLTEADVTPVEVAGPDALAAYERGDVDAFVTIDPNLADVQARTGSRLLTDAQGLVENLYPYVATSDAIATKPAALRAVLTAVDETMAWIPQHRAEHARLLAPKIGFSEAAIETAYSRGAAALQPIDADFLAGEQRWADTYTRLGILKAPIDVAQVFRSDFNDALVTRP